MRSNRHWDWRKLEWTNLPEAIHHICFSSYCVLSPPQINGYIDVERCFLSADTALKIILSGIFYFFKLFWFPWGLLRIAGWILLVFFFVSHSFQLQVNLSERLSILLNCLGCLKIVSWLLLVFRLWFQLTEFASNWFVSLSFYFKVSLLEQFLRALLVLIDFGLEQLLKGTILDFEAYYSDISVILRSLLYR